MNEVILPTLALTSIVLVPIAGLLIYRWASVISRPDWLDEERILDTAKVAVRRDTSLDFTRERMWLVETGLMFAPQRFSTGETTTEGLIHFDEILGCEIESPTVWGLFQHPLRIDTKEQMWRIYFAGLRNVWSFGKKRTWKREIDLRRISGH